MSDYSVYRHIFPNGKSYIGITSQPLEKRFCGGSGYKKCPKMHNAILAYGWNNIEHELLFSNLTKQEAEQKEIEMIAFYDSIKNGYNIDHGGNVPGSHSIETRQKISAGNKGLKKPLVTEERKRALSEKNTGKSNPFYGRHHSVEARANQSARMRGNQYNKGNHHTEEFKAWKSAQMREKYANGNSRGKTVVAVKDGTEFRFPSLRKAAEQAGVSASVLLKNIRERTERNGYSWRYADERQS